MESGLITSIDGGGGVSVLLREGGSPRLASSLIRFQDVFGGGGRAQLSSPRGISVSNWTEQRKTRSPRGGEGEEEQRSTETPSASGETTGKLQHREGKSRRRGQEERPGGETRRRGQEERLGGETRRREARMRPGGETRRWSQRVSFFCGGVDEADVLWQLIYNSPPSF